MTRQVYGLQVLSLALRKIELAWANGNREQAHAAIAYAFDERPRETLADDDGIGYLGLDDLECDLLNDLELLTVGDLRRTGVDKLVRMAHRLPPDRLSRYAESQKVQGLARRSGSVAVARHFAERIQTAMTTFRAPMTREGSCTPVRAFDQSPPNADAAEHAGPESRTGAGDDPRNEAGLEND